MQSTVKIIRFVPKSFFCARARPLWPSRRCTFMCFFFRASPSLCNCAYMFRNCLGFGCMSAAFAGAITTDHLTETCTSDRMCVCVFENKELLRASMYSSLCLCGISGGSGTRSLLSNTKWPWKLHHIRSALGKLFEQIWMREECPFI